MERLSYKGGCGIHKRMRIETFKAELGWTINKWLTAINKRLATKINYKYTYLMTINKRLNIHILT